MTELFPLHPGLTEGEVAERVRRGDVNLVVLRSTRTYAEILRENVFTTFHICFSVVLALLAVMGQMTDAIFSGVTILCNIVVGVVQEVQSKLALDKLALLSVQQVTVRRDGVSLIVPLGEVVRDDLIELKPGDRAPVDGPVVLSEMVEMDESLLTGESDPVPKHPGDEVLSGSFCLAGSCVFRAAKIGNESYAAQISQASRTYRRSLTPLQKKIDVIVEIFAFALIVAGFLHVASSLNSGRSMVDTLRYAAVIINSFVPAGLVLSISVALAIGAVEISRQQTLVQRINAVDSMNSVRVLCTDKTGTLTQNKLQVDSLIPLPGTSECELHDLIALYAHRIVTQNTSARAMAAFVGFPHAGQHKTSEVPFSSALKWGAVTVASDAEPSITILVGSPELLLSDKEAQDKARALGRQGLRVIAVASSALPPVTDSANAARNLPIALPPDRRDRGLIILKDELRPEVPEAIAALQFQGIQVKVISGDSIDTVAAIAAQAGIPATDTTIYTQRDLESLDLNAFQHAAKRGRAFGRITPEMKRRLIAAMVRQGDYVAMVGDGVNDVPAFKEAKLAIAMNDGAQISKDVADLVLLNNSLATLPAAFHAGDLIKQKILSSARLYLTKNLMLILAISFIGFVQLPFPYEPRQNTILTLATVSTPSILISLGMLRPRRVNDFLRSVLGYSGLAGLMGGLAVTVGYVMTYFGGLGLLDVDLAPTGFSQLAGEAQAVAVLIGLFYCTLIFWESAQISIWKPRTLLCYKVPATLGIVSVVLAIALLLGLPDLFQIAPPHRIGWTLAIFLSLAANYILRSIQCSPLLRHLPRSLTQP